MEKIEFDIHDRVVVNSSGDTSVIRDKWIMAPLGYDGDEFLYKYKVDMFSSASSSGDTHYVEWISADFIHGLNKDLLRDKKIQKIIE